ncbi:FAD-dependent oxidoreductase [Dactylosporangium sp. CA-233914]|uniref:FAD-dependent oxidoreductase n=1 Tax=Dactylosporangium sp. CA-233914 TaxID=3239934 RepID=UPI003D8F00CE
MTDSRGVVVGGGIVGLCTAWFLQPAGFEVTVLEKETVGAGSSWANHRNALCPVRARPIVSWWISAVPS